jgi:hypothetical protein
LDQFEYLILYLHYSNIQILWSIVYFSHPFQKESCICYFRAIHLNFLDLRNWACILYLHDHYKYCCHQYFVYPHNWYNHFQNKFCLQRIYFLKWYHPCRSLNFSIASIVFLQINLLDRRKIKFYYEVWKDQKEFHRYSCSAYDRNSHFQYHISHFERFGNFCFHICSCWSFESCLLRFFNEYGLLFNRIWI